MSAESIVEFACFFVATVTGASILGCAVDRSLTTWHAARGHSSGRPD